MGVISWLGGNSPHAPELLKERISPGARKMVEAAFADVEPGALRDYHVHIIGFGDSGSGAWVNPKMRSWRHPLDRLKALFYLSGAGVGDERDSDRHYVERLVSLIRAIDGHGTYGILGFDWYRGADGRIIQEKSEFHTPNDYVLELADKYPNAFFPIPSVHPYREDALEELDKCGKAGARIIKWLPNAQGMNAADPRCEAFYDRMKKWGMALLTHAGKEMAVEAGDDQALGNPLLFRKPLEMGVKVIMAHAASLGDNEDLDHPGRRVNNFDLLLRLFGEPKYEGLLFADISATTQFNRLPQPLGALLGRRDLHPRLVNGSDYPLPALNIMVQTRKLVGLGMINKGERKLLNEIFSYNPLLFDYVVKRVIRQPETGSLLPSHLFTEHPDLPVR